MEDEQALINDHTNRRVFLKKINYSYLFILFFILANLTFNILIFFYISSITNFIKEKVQEAENEDLDVYIHKFKYIIDYFCSNLVKCE